MSLLNKKKGDRTYPFLLDRKTPLVDALRGTGEEGGALERVRERLKKAKGSV